MPSKTEPRIKRCLYISAILCFAAYLLHVLLTKQLDPWQPQAFPYRMSLLCLAVSALARYACGVFLFCIFQRRNALLRGFGAYAALLAGMLLLAVMMQALFSYPGYVSFAHALRQLPLYLAAPLLCYGAACLLFRYITRPVPS